MKTFALTVTYVFALTYVGIAQNFEPDATIWLDPWVSCEKKANPKKVYGKSHWIQYDLGYLQNLSKSWVWNVNDPDKLDQGFKEVKIDYSEDGQNWTFHQEMTFPKGEGAAIYGGFPGPDLVGVSARYILITVESNHGDKKCAGLTEVKFNLLPMRVAGTYDEPDEEDEDECDDRGLVVLNNGERLELDEFDPHHSHREGYTIETTNGWRDIEFDLIDKVYIKHIKGNKFEYDVRTKDGGSVQGSSNVFRNFVDGETAEGKKTIEYTEINYFSFLPCE